MNRRVLNPDVRQHIPALDMYQPYLQLDDPPTPDVPPCIALRELAHQLATLLSPAYNAASSSNRPSEASAWQASESSAG